ncbi:3-keto-disaccharide hydrolase [Bradyrhizobium sp. 23AC]
MWPETHRYHAPPWRTSNPCRLVPHTTRTDVAKGPWQWNTFVIEAIGSRITVTLNDVVVNDFIDPRPRSLRGHIARQNHHDGSKVQFRNIRIKAVVPGVTGLPVARLA